MAMQDVAAMFSGDETFGPLTGRGSAPAPAPTRQQRVYYAVAHTYGCHIVDDQGRAIGTLYGFEQRADRDDYADDGTPCVTEAGYREAVTEREARHMGFRTRASTWLPAETIFVPAQRCKGCAAVILPETGSGGWCDTCLDRA